MAKEAYLTAGNFMELAFRWESFRVWAPSILTSNALRGPGIIETLSDVVNVTLGSSALKIASIKINVGYGWANAYNGPSKSLLKWQVAGRAFRTDSKRFAWLLGYVQTVFNRWNDAMRTKLILGLLICLCVGWHSAANVTQATEDQNIGSTTEEKVVVAQQAEVQEVQAVASQSQVVPTCQAVPNPERSLPVNESALPTPAVDDSLPPLDKLPRSAELERQQMLSDIKGLRERFGSVVGSPEEFQGAVRQLSQWSTPSSESRSDPSVWGTVPPSLTPLRSDAFPGDLGQIPQMGSDHLSHLVPTVPAVPEQVWSGNRQHPGTNFYVPAQQFGDSRQTNNRNPQPPMPYGQFGQYVPNMNSPKSGMQNPQQFFQPSGSSNYPVTPTSQTSSTRPNFQPQPQPQSPPSLPRANRAGDPRTSRSGSVAGLNDGRNSAQRSMLTEEKILRMRDVSRSLEAAAWELEEIQEYQMADQLREKANALRNQCRNQQ